MVSLNTMRTHTKNIYAKLAVTSPRDAVRRAAELGFPRARNPQPSPSFTEPRPGRGCLLRLTACPPRVNHHINPDRKSTRLNSSHLGISYAVFCLKKKK